jgi:hypothetical protein
MRPSAKLFDEVPFTPPKKRPISHAITADERKAGRKREPRAITRLKALDGGKEGAKVTTVKLRISGKRNDLQTIRAKPGTFEWRYGRNKQSALFHAGSHLAILWERAGLTIASSANFLRGTSSGYATGISDGRVAAVDRLDGFVVELGRQPAARLVDYCVGGMTSKEIARKHGATEREMASVLHHDLRACAAHFRFTGRAPKR